MGFKVHSNSPEETIRCGERLGRQFKGDEVVLISGELGVGKTLFTKGIAKAMGIDPNEIVSPTFVLMNQYQHIHRLYHFDLYRLGLSGKVLDPGIDEYIGEGVLVVEWAQYLPQDFFSGVPVVNVSILDQANDRRTIHIQTDHEYIRQWKKKQ